MKWRLMFIRAQNWRLKFSIKSEVCKQHSLVTAIMATAPKNARSVYLITYSQANLEIVDTREKFVQIVLEAFSQGSSTSASNLITRWCCSQEHHEDGNIHYHMGIKLQRQKRWLSHRNYLQHAYNVKVNFSDSHSNYYEAWLYCTKSDANAIFSIGHPDLTNPPRTNVASVRRRAQSGNAAERPASKKPRFDALQLSNLILRNKIKTETELMSLAHAQKAEGKTDVCLFLLNNKLKCSSIITTTWKMEEAAQILQRQKKSRWEILQQSSNGECVEGCHGQWKQYAIETLQRNHVHVQYFANKVKESLVQGRGKKRNILIVGPANCGKTFLIKPLSDIFNAFVNPATGSFAWLGIEEGEVIILNDFRWCDKIISWQDFLKLLEGDTVHIPSPKTHFEKDIIFSKDTPIFCTAAEEFQYYSHGKIQKVETEMMEVRWETFHFFHQLSTAQSRDITPCAKCFADLIITPQL